MNTEDEKQPAKPTGRRYTSVEELMDGEGLGQDVKAKFVQMEGQTRVVAQLAKLRQRAGITQEEMAAHLEVSQSAISKLESSLDDDLTLREIKGYARVTSQRIGISFGKPPSHVEAVKGHALAMKSHLEALARIANQHTELEKDIKGFFGEAFFNLLDIMAACGDRLPKSGDESDVRIEVLQLARSDSQVRLPRGRSPQPATA